MNRREIVMGGAAVLITGRPDSLAAAEKQTYASIVRDVWASIDRAGGSGKSCESVIATKAA